MAQYGQVAVARSNCPGQVLFAMRRPALRDSTQIRLARLLLAVACLALAAFLVSSEMRAENSDFRRVVWSLPTAGALVFAAIGTLFRSDLRAMAAGYMAICVLECLVGLVCYCFRMCG